MNLLRLLSFAKQVFLLIGIVCPLWIVLIVTISKGMSVRLATNALYLGISNYQLMILRA